MVDLGERRERERERERERKRKGRVRYGHERLSTYHSNSDGVSA